MSQYSKSYKIVFSFENISDCFSHQQRGGGQNFVCADFPKARPTWSIVEKVQVISSLQTSFYKTVVRDQYFLLEYKMCEK